MKPGLSVCMIVRDEERNLPIAYASVADVADEVVICDTGSTDNTVAIAEALGARVVHFEWCDDFSAARNYAASHARHRWILALDADEMLVPYSVEPLRDYVATAPPVGTVLRVLAPTLHEATRRGFAHQRWSLRPLLYPNEPRFVFEGNVHELLTDGTSDPFRLLDVSLLHWGYFSPRLNRQKRERNRRINAARCDANLERGLAGLRAEEAIVQAARAEASTPEEAP